MGERCWCGVDNAYFAPLTTTCGGSCTVRCDCGGDICVCHWHGEIPCPGCEDCDEDEDDG